MVFVYILGPNQPNWVFTVQAHQVSPLSCPALRTLDPSSSSTPLVGAGVHSPATTPVLFLSSDLVEFARDLSCLGSMTTAYENDDMINSEVENTEQLSSEPISTEEISTQQINTELADSGGVGSDQVQPPPTKSEPVHEDSLSLQVGAVHSEQGISELVDSQTVNAEPAGSEMIHPQQDDSEPANTEIATSELIPEDQATGDFIYSQDAVSLEPENPETAGTEFADTQHDSEEPDCSEEINEDVSALQPINSEHSYESPVNTELPGTEPVDSEQVETLHDDHEVTYMEAVGSEAAHFEPASTEPVGTETVDSEAVHVDPTSYKDVHLDQASFHQEHSHTVGSEDVHAEIVDQEIVHSQPVATEPEGPDNSYAVSLEADHSHQVGTELHSEAMNAEHETTEHHMSQTDDMEIENMQPESHGTNMELMISDHAASQAVNTEYMSMEPMYADSMGLEQHHSQHAGSELEYSQHYSSDLDHTQPLEIVYTQSTGTELVHSQTGEELHHLQPGSSELVLSQGFNYETVDLNPTGLELANSQYANTELITSEQADPETQPNKRRKKKSIVWEHFTIESVGNGCRRACCKVCKQSFAYSTGSKVAGTSHLKRHIAKGSCPVILRQQERNQLSPYMPKSGGTETGTGTDPPKRRYRSSSSPYLIFDQDKCRHEIARMIIMHDYPLHIVEHPGFIAFVQNLQPRFDMVNIETVRGDCVATYLKEKQKLQNFINSSPGCICLALDVWTSNQSTSYVFLTGQFIDSDWKSHRRLLNVVMEPFPESEGTLSHAVSTCVSYWSMGNRLSSITVEQPLSDIGRENLRSLLSRKNPRTLNGQLLLASCIARALSGMALEVLATGQHAVKKVRDSVKYVKASDSYEQKFLELKQRLQVPTERTLVLDNLTRWDSTYQMLLAASDLMEVFSCLDTSDSEYMETPSLEEWKQVESLCSQLKLLYETATLLTEKVNPPPNVFFHEAWKIQLELARTAASDDPFVSSLAKPMQDKFKKYWEDSCLVLAIAVAMDPRFKMKLVEFSFTKIFGEQAPSYIRAVDEGIHEIFREYEALPASALNPNGEHGNGMHVKMEQQEGGNFLSSNGLTDFDMYIMETTSQLSKSELDQYLEESLLPRVQDFDILGWWKLNRIKYPTLSKLARDILTIPLSTVGPDLVFDTVSREMDSCRSLLRPETLEALICAKDWLRYDTSPDASSSEAVKMEI
ncbi:Zinc finger BED domain-containing protein [Drosera capensis]